MSARFRHFCDSQIAVSLRSFTLLASAAANADTIRVPQDAPTTQAGIDLAENGDVVLVDDGTFTGDGNRNIQFRGKAITVRSVNGPEATVVDCERAGQGFLFLQGEGPDSVLDGLSIINGAVTQPGKDSGGGGIRIGDPFSGRASATIRNCRIIACHDDNSSPGEGNGGGIYINGDATLSGCVIEDCRGHHGGGIYVRIGSVQITDCIVRSNSSTYRTAGIAASATTDIINSVIEDNSVLIDGIGGISGGRLIQDCRIAGNSGSLNDPDIKLAGGGVTGGQNVVRCIIEDNGGDIGGLAHCGLVRDSVIRNNSGWYAGGVGVVERVENCLIEANRTDIAGAGAAYLRGGAIVNSTLTGNDGIDAVVWFDGGSPRIENSIIRGNEPAGFLITDAAPIVNYSNVEGGWEGEGEGNIDVDPAWVDPESGDYHLAPGSPCIDAGDADAVSTAHFQDLAGFPRRVDDPATPDTGVGPAPLPDMGAYEFGAESLCADVRRMKLVCRNGGKLKAKLRTNLPQATALLLVRDGADLQSPSANELGVVKFRWANQSGSHEVCVAGCDDLCRQADCG